MNANEFQQILALRQRRRHHGSQGFRGFGELKGDVRGYGEASPQLSRPQFFETVAISVTVMVVSQLILRVLTRD